MEFKDYLPYVDEIGKIFKDKKFNFAEIESIFTVIKNIVNSKFYNTSNSNICILKDDSYCNVAQTIYSFLEKDLLAKFPIESSDTAFYIQRIILICEFSLFHEKVNAIISGIINSENLNKKNRDKHGGIITLN